MLRGMTQNSTVGLLLARARCSLTSLASEGAIKAMMFAIIFKVISCTGGAKDLPPVQDSTVCFYNPHISPIHLSKLVSLFTALLVLVFVDPLNFKPYLPSASFLAHVKFVDNFYFEISLQ